MRIFRTGLAALILVAILAGCGKESESDVTIIGGADGPTSVFLAGKISSDSYTQIDQETAKLMMDLDDGHVVVDVRRPDFDQVILIYCRSGRRSKEASQKLYDMGYTNVFEFGGIIDWTGDVVTGE